MPIFDHSPNPALIRHCPAARRHHPGIVRGNRVRVLVLALVLLVGMVGGGVREVFAALQHASMSLDAPLDKAADSVHCEQKLPGDDNTTDNDTAPACLVHCLSLVSGVAASNFENFPSTFPAHWSRVLTTSPATRLHGPPLRPPRS